MLRIPNKKIDRTFWGLWVPNKKMKKENIPVTE